LQDLRIVAAIMGVALVPAMLWVGAEVDVA